MSPRLLWLARAAACLASALMVWPFVYDFARGSDAYLAIFTDDFYYYAIVADHFVHSGQWTFDGGVTATNGFHPLFMLALVAFDFVGGGLTPVFFALLVGLSFLAPVVTFELYERLGRAIFPESRLRLPLALLMAFETARIAVWGMETTLAMPLHVLWLLAVATTRSFTPKRSLALGLLSAALVLARLDTAQQVGLFVLASALFLRPAGALKPKNVAAFGAGLAPLALYAAYNVSRFGGVMPFSAQAKQMKVAPGFNAHLLGDLFERSLGKVALVAIPVALVLFLLRARRTVRDGASVSLALALVFPVVFYGTFGVRSDWRIFDWYLYPLPPAIFAAGLLFEDAIAERMAWLRSARCAWVMGAVTALATVAVAGRMAYARSFGFRASTTSVYHHAKLLADATRWLPGRLAMGDRAGLTSYLLDRPIVQLEGLMADRAMIEHIRRQDDLREVLLAYGVDYLIVTVFTPLPVEAGCPVVTTPHPRQAGFASPRMTGSFCDPPVLELHTTAGMRGGFAPEAYTYVFPVSPRALASPEERPREDDR